MRRLRDLGLLAPTAALAAAAMTVFVASLVIWSLEVDEQTRLREEALMAEGLHQAVAEVERAILPETVWDEAVQFLDHRQDVAWAEQNLNDFYALGFEFSHLTVLDDQDRPFYHREGRISAPLDAADLTAFMPVIAAVRGAERARRPTAAARDRAVQASAFMSHQGEVVLATATLVQPEGAGLRLRGERAPLLLTVLPIDQVAIDVLQTRYLVKGLQSGLGSQDVGAGLARASFASDGQVGPPLTLSWTPHRPGRDLLVSSIAPVAGVLLAFGAVAAVMILRARRAWQEQVAAQRSQAEFLANMSHEIRTPLNGVCAVAEALQGTRLTDSQKEMVEIIRSSGASLERLLSDLLDVSRIDLGAVRISPEPFHLAESVRTLGALLAPRAREKGLGFRLSIDPAAEGLVVGDPVRLKQILANLVGNAIKFTAEGEVQIAVEPRQDGWWRLTVSDTGAGFDAAQKAELFRRFVQGDGSFRRQHGGLGLGLSLCAQLARLMGGSLDAESQPGQGSSFWVDLPLPATLQPANQPPEAEAEAGRPLRILVADDHPTNRRIIQALLAQFDVELVLAEDGAQACDAFSQSPFDIVLMDMQMPVMDGLTAIRNIRELEVREHRGHTPIVMLTANTLPEHQAASLEAGADIYMPKPIKADRLFAVLNTVSEGQAAA